MQDRLLYVFSEAREKRGYGLHTYRTGQTVWFMTSIHFSSLCTLSSGVVYLIRAHNYIPTKCYLKYRSHDTIEINTKHIQVDKRTDIVRLF